MIAASVVLFVGLGLDSILLAVFLLEIRAETETKQTGADVASNLEKHLHSSLLS